MPLRKGSSLSLYDIAEDASAIYLTKLGPWEAGRIVRNIVKEILISYRTMKMLKVPIPIDTAPHVFFSTEGIIFFSCRLHLR